MSATFTARVSQALVAAGRTNDAIAEALSLSPCTIERHLSNIHVKLGAERKAAPCRRRRGYPR
jgi:DNA-binding NarL/FixJ family response regulator